jgi:uncharacterized BrkB/YihY/UPF0761 family membrane protein
MAWIALIIVLAILFGVLGAVIKGLLWLLVIGIILFVGGALYGVVKSRSHSGTHRR